MLHSKRAAWLDFRVLSWSWPTAKDAANNPQFDKKSQET
jgi:hypothetical protein